MDLSLGAELTRFYLHEAGNDRRAAVTVSSYRTSLTAGGETSEVRGMWDDELKDAFNSKQFIIIYII